MKTIDGETVHSQPKRVRDRRKNHLSLHLPMPDLFVECELKDNPRLLTVGVWTYSIRPDGLVEKERTDHTGQLCEPPEELRRHVKKQTGMDYEDYISQVVEAHRASEADRRIVGNRS